MHRFRIAMAALAAIVSVGALVAVAASSQSWRDGSVSVAAYVPSQAVETRASHSLESNAGDLVSGESGMMMLIRRKR